MRLSRVCRIMIISLLDPQDAVDVVGHDHKLIALHTGGMDGYPLPIQTRDDPTGGEDWLAVYEVTEIGMSVSGADRDKVQAA